MITRHFPATGQMVTVDGVRLHVEDSGDTDVLPILLVHGASANLHDSLAAASGVFPGRRVIAVDRPGHGYSRRRGRGDANPERQAALLSGLLDQLGIQRAIIIGHSMGSATVAAFAVHHPEKVAGLVFVAPATHPWPGGVTWYYDLAARPILGRLFAATLVLPAGLISLTSGSRSVFDPDPMPADYIRAARIPLVLRPFAFVANAEDVAALKDHVTRLSPRYREITAPTVILTGDRDEIVWPEIHSRGLARDIVGARLIIAEGAGHRPHHSRPELFRLAVDDVTGRAKK